MHIFHLLSSIVIHIRGNRTSVVAGVDYRGNYARSAADERSNNSRCHSITSFHLLRTVKSVAAKQHTDNDTDDKIIVHSYHLLCCRILPMSVLGSNYRNCDFCGSGNNGCKNSAHDITSFIYAVIMSPTNDYIGKLVGTVDNVLSYKKVHNITSFRYGVLLSKTDSMMQYTVSRGSKRCSLNECRQSS